MLIAHYLLRQRGEIDIRIVDHILVLVLVPYFNHVDHGSDHYVFFNPGEFNQVPGYQDTPRRIGIVGLGIGTLAAYGREGDLVRFYEIDPAVVRVAQDAEYFHFLTDSPAKIEIVVGDARLSLATEQERGSSQKFDFLIIDAFSSDAIPVHLLTREAFARYEGALVPGGLLAVHVTNRYFDLMPLVARLGMEFQFESLQVTTNKAQSLHSLGAKWVMLSGIVYLFMVKG